MTRDSVTGFFKLPRELRDLIYHFLWLDLPDLVVPYLDDKSLIRYNGTNEACSKTPDEPWTRKNELPDWFFLNKVFKKESYTTLIKRAEWIYIPDRRPRRNAGSSTLFGPSTAHIVTVRVREHSQGLFSSTPIVSVFPGALMVEKLRKDAMSYRQIAKDMAENGRLKSLHLWFDALMDDGFYGYRSFFGGSAIFLAPLQDANITTLVIYIGPESSNPSKESPGQLEWLRTCTRAFARHIFEYEARSGFTGPEIECEKHWRDSELAQDTVQHWYRFRPGAAPRHQIGHSCVTELD
jgi:hypothetical protein